MTYEHKYIWKWISISQKLFNGIKEIDYGHFLDQYYNIITSSLSL